MSTIAESLGYEMTERTRLKVYVEGCGEDRSLEVLGPFMSFEDAQRAYRGFWEENWTGKGLTVGLGAVHDEFGQHLARICANGKLWGPLPWKPGDEPVADFPAFEPGHQQEADEDGPSL